MFLPTLQQLKHITGIIAVMLLLDVQSAKAAGPPVPSSIENPLVIGLVIMMLLMLLIIGLLANLLMGVAEVKMKKEKKTAAAAVKPAVAAIVAFFFMGNALFAQSGTAANTPAAAGDTIGGLSPTAFYIMVSVIFVELMVILGLLINTRILLKAEKAKLAEEGEATVIKKPTVNWWTKFNRLKPIEQEADLDLGHDYDGIRELDNRLPPWWLYGFYLTILTAGIYLYRYHVSHTGLSSKQEYETAVATADMEVKEYLKKKGDAVDENTVVLLTSTDDKAAGKAIFMKSCVACHKEDGRGDVGPNLTDDYWIHGGDIKNVFKTIRYGINAMPQWQNTYSNKEIAQVASYVKSLKGTNPANAKAPQGTLYTEDTTAAKPVADTTAKVVK